jgi:hypothetical protein
LLKLRKRLKSWGNKYISLGGSTVLLSAVPNSIPIFILSYLRMRTQVWKKVVRIQREFLWGGVTGGRNINWSNGGLGVRDIRVVNISLLANWRWRLLQRQVFVEGTEGCFGGQVWESYLV